MYYVHVMLEILLKRTYYILCTIIDSIFPWWLRECHAHSNVSLVAHVSDPLALFQIVELNGADTCVMFVNGFRQ